MTFGLSELELIGCPECGAPAEVEWRATAGSTSGPAEHLKIRCVNRHWFLMLADRAAA
ncbi:hypothetical protein ACPPVT_00280 [Angustibacter sp. McL0619]|uniref:hypothetical protein n=1 Tax=Angustibacter sp. McL0619 TaxID=3415676 RepID=UPI003CFA0340